MEFKQDVKKLTHQIKTGAISMFDSKIDEAIVERFKTYEEIGERSSQNQQTEEDKIFNEEMKTFFNTLRNSCNIALKKEIYGKNAVENRFVEIIDMSAKCGEHLKKGYNTSNEQVF